MSPARPFPPFAIPTQRDPEPQPLPALTDPNPIEREALAALHVPVLRILAGALRTPVEAGGCKAELVERIGGRP